MMGRRKKSLREYVRIPARQGQAKVPSFFDLLRQTIRGRRDLKNWEIAERSGVDDSTLSVLITRDSTRIRSPKLELRLKLAVGLSKTWDEAQVLAKSFVEADPVIDTEGWKMLFSDWYLKLLQTEVRLVEISMPADLVVAPFWVAQELGYFGVAGLEVFFSHRHNALNWGLYPQSSHSHRIKVGLYDRQKILLDSADTVFCSPLAVQVEHDHLPSYGLVCTDYTYSRQSAQLAIVQVIWAWYKAVRWRRQEPEQHDRMVAELYHQYTNEQITPQEVRERRLKQPYLEFDGPTALLRALEGCRGYPYRFFDSTNHFAHHYKVIEKLLD